MVEHYNYSLPGQTKGSHCLGLGAATPPHNHPTLALADTAQPRRYGYNTHILGQCKDVPKQKTYTVPAGPQSLLPRHTVIAVCAQWTRESTAGLKVPNPNGL